MKLVNEPVISWAWKISIVPRAIVYLTVTALMCLSGKMYTLWQPDPIQFGPWFTKWMQALARVTLFCMGVSRMIVVDERGKEIKDPKLRGKMMVANHFSFLEITAFAALHCPIAYVSKMDVISMPFIGYLALLGGGIGVNKKDPFSKEKCKAYVTKHAHYTWGIFPEGTTNRGDELLPFHSYVFDMGIPITPVIFLPGTDARFIASGISPHAKHLTHVQEREGDIGTEESMDTAVIKLFYRPMQPLRVIVMDDMHADDVPVVIPFAEAVRRKMAKISKFSLVK